MYDINLRNVKKGRGFFAIFFIFGIVFLAAPLFSLIEPFIERSKLSASTLSLPIKETNQEEDYDNSFFYSVDGVLYECSSSLIFVVPEEKRLVYYDPNDPSRCIVDGDFSYNAIPWFVFALPLIFILISVFNFIKINKRIKIIKELNQKGKLVKCIPYHLEDSGMAINNVPIKMPVIDYILPDGRNVILRGDPRHDGKVYDEDGLVDLIIDESNPRNYFIDFEINRLTGNTKSDYFQIPETETKTNIYDHNDINIFK